MARAPVHVALLRGINVAGKNRLAMKDLAAIFEAEGCEDVRTYIQSGNVIFRAGKRLAHGLSTQVAEAIALRHRLQVPVVVRTGAEMVAVARSSPFLRAGADPATLHVVFLADRPSSNLVKLLDPARSPPDEYVVEGREIHLRCPAGLGRSKLTNAYFDAKLETVSTIRNWKTVLELAAEASR